MSRKDLENFFIESACLTLQGECEMFANYYHLAEVKVDYEIKDDGNGLVYLIDGENKTLLGEIDYQKAVKYWRNPQILLSNPFNEIMVKYEIMPIGEATIEIQDSEEETNE